MSKKRILFWATSLIPVAATVGSLASCSCNDANNKGTYIEEPSTDKREFKLSRAREFDIADGGEYLFTIGGFKAKNVSIKGKWNISAKLVVGDETILLSLKEKNLRRDGQLSFTLYSKEWDELVAISGSDTPYEIKDLSIKYNRKELLVGGTGYSVLIQTGLAGPAVGDDDFTGELQEQETSVTMEIPDGDYTNGCFELCNPNGAFDENNIFVEGKPLDSQFPGVFSDWKLNKYDTPNASMYYLTTTCTKLPTTLSVIRTTLTFKIMNGSDHNVVYYENDGILEHNDFVYGLLYYGAD